MQSERVWNVVHMWVWYVRVVWGVCVCAGVWVEVCDGVGSLCLRCGCGMWRA